MTVRSITQTLAAVRPLTDTDKNEMLKYLVSGTDNGYTKERAFKMPYYN